jgi:hypothetical protein
VKWLMRGLTVLLFFVGTVGIVGCQPENETEAQRLAKGAGDPGKPDAKGVPTTTVAPPTSQEEFGRRARQQTEGMLKKGAYPGAK